MKGFAAPLLVLCARLCGACGSGGKDKHGAGDAGPDIPADGGWYVPDAGPPTSMRLTGHVGTLGKGPRAGGTMRVLEDDLESNRTCGGTVCVTGAIEP